MAVVFRPADSLHARADRAIAKRLLATEALLNSHRDTLKLTQRSLQLASQMGDADFRPQLLPCLTNYYRAHGHLLERTKRLGQDIDRVLVTRIAVA